MIDDILQVNGLSLEILKFLSFKSNLGLSLKRDLHYFDQNDLFDELQEMTYWIQERPELEDIAIDYRIKSMDSIKLKYQRYYPNHQVRKVFNDILGFRALCDDYNDIFAMTNFELRVVDMIKGKSSDDGYRGVHLYYLYYQKDNFHYPIEIQFNTLYDRQINNWLHAYIYKKGYPDEVGLKMRTAYESGRIKNAAEFEEVLNSVLYSCEG